VGTCNPATYTGVDAIPPRSRWLPSLHPR
jgi:hypothetical protein